MAISTEGLLDRARSSGSLESVLFQGIGGTLFAIGASLISGILTIADLVIKPLRALGSALGGLVGAIFGGPIKILDAGAFASAQSLLGRFNIGPFTWLLAIAVVLGGFWIIARFLQERETSNVIPGAPFDISIPGFRDEEGGD